MRGALGAVEERRPGLVALLARAVESGARRHAGACAGQERRRARDLTARGV